MRVNRGKVVDDKYNVIRMNELAVEPEEWTSGPQPASSAAGMKDPRRRRRCFVVVVVDVAKVIHQNRTVSPLSLSTAPSLLPNWRFIASHSS